MPICLETSSEGPSRHAEFPPQTSGPHGPAAVSCALLISACDEIEAAPAWSADSLEPIPRALRRTGRCIVEG